MSADNITSLINLPINLISVAPSVNGSERNLITKSRNERHFNTTILTPTTLQGSRSCRLGARVLGAKDGTCSNENDITN
jgi:hypothetical protein